MPSPSLPVRRRRASDILPSSAAGSFTSASDLGSIGDMPAASAAGSSGGGGPARRFPGPWCADPVQFTRSGARTPPGWRSLIHRRWPASSGARAILELVRWIGDLTRINMLACWVPQYSAHCPGRTPLVGLEGHGYWCVPGQIVLPARRGTQKLWQTSATSA